MRHARRRIKAMGLLACFGIIGFLAYDYATAEKKWMTWKAERQAKGDCYEWACLAPPEVKKVENFADTPIVVAALKGFENPDPRLLALKRADFATIRGCWHRGRREDLKAYAPGSGAGGALIASAEFEELLREVETASRRPGSKLPLGHKVRNGADRDLTGFILIARGLRIRAFSRLAANRVEESLEDLKTYLRIAKHLKAEPYPLAALAQIFFIDHAIGLVWEGIQDRLWSDDQLRLLIAELGCIDLLFSARQAWQGERLYLSTTFEHLAEGSLIQSLSEPWKYRNLLEIDRFFSLCQIDAIDVQRHRVFPDRCVAARDYEKANLLFRPDLAEAYSSLSDHRMLTSFAAFFQSGLDKAAVACALERHRLANGGYPASLSELVPAYIERVPHDLVNGLPLKYLRDDKSYQLYSVGWNLNDDQGAVALCSVESASPNEFEGDWPWIMTATPANGGEP
jgi:hypothetical protein